MDHHQHHHTTTHPNPNPNPNPGISEGDRLLGIAEKLLQTRDLPGSREFALLAQESEPLLEGSDQILAITDVLLAAERRVVNNRHHDWYGILQINPLSLSSDPDLLKKNYRRLALLLHPDKNHFPFADVAFKLVADAWALLSDPSRRGLYDHELSVYEKGNLQNQHQNPPPPPPPSHAEKDKLPVRRSQHQQGGGDGGRSQPKTDGGKFWTACPYCYVLFEYSRRYEDCCLRCRNCERAYHAAAINSLPPMVPGKEAYYCCWGFFPLGFSLENGSMGKKDNNHGINNGHNPGPVFPNWMPSGTGTFPTGGGNVNRSGGIDISDGVGVGVGDGGGGDNGVSGGFARGSGGVAKPGAKKRGRPRKNP